MAPRTLFSLKALDIVRLFSFSLFVQFIVITAANGYAIETIPKTGIWLPIPREVIYNRYKHNIEQNQGFGNIYQSHNWGPSRDLTNGNIHEVTENAIQIVNSSFLARAALAIDEFKIPDKKIEETTRQKETFNKTCSEETNSCINDTKETYKEDTNKGAQRLRTQPRSLKLEAIDTLNHIIYKKQYLGPINKVNDTNDKTLSGEPARKTYEVSEQFIDQSTEETIIKESGYIYNVPNIDKPLNNSIENNFYAILAKYKINTDDYLNNYELSQRETTSNHTQNHKPVGIILQPWGPHHQRYNSQNHLPLNPLLAVFLSNYGYYLPGHYKMNGGYKNLYGYLASNNIHNNKPFGLYKVFSDTDALH